MGNVISESTEELTTAIQAVEAPKATAAMMPTLPPIAGPAAVYQERYIQESHRVDIGQLYANEDTNASAWINANPTTPNHRMTDAAFIISCQIRLMQDVMRNDPLVPKICAAVTGSPLSERKRQKAKILIHSNIYLSCYLK